MAQDSTEIFEAIIERVKVLDPVNSRSWFDNLKYKNFSGGQLDIECPDSQSAGFLQDVCSRSFTLAAQQITGHLVSVNFVSDLHPSHAARPIVPLKLHPDYTFDNFVVGPCNRLAHASCVAVSKSPGKTYNPLFIYGTVGLGKTHLLHAICRETINSLPNAKIQFISCEEFVNRFINAIEA
ncbi:MAG: DnaA/Hda family protein, partial [Phycisphaerales bacterium]